MTILIVFDIGGRTLIAVVRGCAGTRRVGLFARRASACVVPIVIDGWAAAARRRRCSVPPAELGGLLVAEDGGGGEVLDVGVHELDRVVRAAQYPPQR